MQGNTKDDIGKYDSDVKSKCSKGQVKR